MCFFLRFASPKPRLPLKQNLLKTLRKVSTHGWFERGIFCYHQEFKFGWKLGINSPTNYRFRLGSSLLINSQLKQQPA
jgi:hypothetical protein